MRSGVESERRIWDFRLFWKLQSYILIAVACTSFFPVLFRYQEHAVIILIVLSLGICAVEKESSWIRSPLDLPLWLFIGWVLCTVPFAVDPAYSFAEWKKFVAQAGVFYWSLLVLHRCREKNLFHQVLLSLALGGTILAAYSLIDFAGRGGTWRDRFIRAQAFGSDYNWLSTYMVMTIPVIGGLIVMSRLAWIRGLQLVALALALTAQVFSYTRGGWLGHAVQAVMLALLVGGRRLIMGVLGMLLLAGAGLFLASQSGFQSETVDAKNVDARLAVWAIGLREMSTHPIAGIGYGNDSFIKKFPQYSIEAQAKLPDRERMIPAMHSTFLMVALGSGIPAILCLAWIFVALMRRLAFFSCSSGREPRATVIAVGIGLAVIGFGVRNFFDYMFMGSLAHLFWLLAAVGISVTYPTWRLSGEA
jgi:heptosyltransferase-3/putative inorganic carbon (HCO3(-)) transporter